MAERYVHLVRHGPPLIDHQTAASQWHLDPDGAEAVLELRRSGRLPKRAAWFCSPEPKARETARLLTDGAVTVVDDLREQVRLHAGWIEDMDAVRRRAFEEPDSPAYEGWEPLAVTRRRATAAVRRLMRDHPQDDLVIVGHGTCLSLLVAELTGSTPNASAPEAMAMPDVVTVRLESSAQPGPLTLPVVLVVALVVSLIDVVVWLVTGRPGLVVAPALVVAGLVAAPRQTRDVGVSLVVVVLLAAFLDLGWLNFIPRLRG
ncbi:histidine phosphatase family protein [Nocardioides mangrovicus]|uniref:Histidine phosphatase family protein n=1 Tax=Nocardioides mangrovicus TaxID=2478913 RepID=A0A3L8P2R1_9ACTN|nr:histidine phosphatase family protein [Nocardioides mangrovicus]RLV48849.1 histidine phosphatase family protein [Nocardioides mangrovicus]